MAPVALVLSQAWYGSGTMNARASSVTHSGLYVPLIWKTIVEAFRQMFPPDKMFGVTPGMLGPKLISGFDRHRFIQNSMSRQVTGFPSDHTYGFSLIVTVWLSSE